MDPLVKKILNSLRCPICKSQIDLFQAKKKNGNNFACATNHTHYAMFFVSWDLPYRIEQEDVQVYSGNYLYEIRQHHYLSPPSLPPMKCNETLIYIKEVDKELRVIEKGKLLKFQYPQLLFDFQNTTNEKIINRVKTILVFQ